MRRDVSRLMIWCVRCKIYWGWEGSNGLNVTCVWYLYFPVIFHFPYLLTWLFLQWRLDGKRVIDTMGSG